MTSSPLPQLSFLSELRVENMFNFVRNYKATPHLSVDKLEKILILYWVKYGSLYSYRVVPYGPDCDLQIFCSFSRFEENP